MPVAHRAAYTNPCIKYIIPLKIARLHGFARKRCLTPAFSADPQMGEGGDTHCSKASVWPFLPLARQHPAGKTNTNVFSRLCTPEIPSSVFSGDYALPGEGGTPGLLGCLRELIPDVAL
jgi:hypothetical protein